MPANLSSDHLDVFEERDGNGPQVVVLKTQRHPMKNYNYLVIDPGSRQAVLVDPAWEMETIDRALADTGAVLCGILITHSHPDHTHLAGPLAEKYDCPIWMSAEEIKASAFNANHLVAVDGHCWTVGQMRIEPIITPGHTRGSTCYLIADNCFTGDVLFAEGCGLCPDIEAAHAMFFSLQKLKTRLKPQTLVFPGHSYGKTPGQPMSQLLKENIYLQFSNQDLFAAFRLRKGQDKSRMFTFS